MCVYSTSYRDTLESERLADCFQQRNAILESLRVTQVHLLGQGNRGKPRRTHDGKKESHFLPPVPPPLYPETRHRTLVGVVRDDS